MNLLLGKARWRLGLLGLVLAFGSARAFFTIDFNEQWLRQDAYSRAMNQAKKNLQPPEEPETTKDVKTDMLYTGALVRVGDDFLSDTDGVDELAQLLPAAQRKEGRRLLVEGIDRINGSVERLYGIPSENVATGLVALLGGAHAAYFNRPLADEAVRPAFLQIAAYLRRSPEHFENESAEKMMYSYQISMGLGFLLTALQQELEQHPDPAKAAELKAIGRLVFRALLNVEPEQVDFTPAGLHFK